MCTLNYSERLFSVAGYTNNYPGNLALSVSIKIRLFLKVEFRLRALPDVREFVEQKISF